jgi:hypothetical protein
MGESVYFESPQKQVDLTFISFLYVANAGKTSLLIHGARFEVLASLLFSSGRGLTWLSPPRRHTLDEVLKQDKLVTQAPAVHMPEARASL